MSTFACEKSRLLKEKIRGWDKAIRARFYEALDSLCEDPDSGRYDAEEDIGSYEDKSEKPHIHITYRIYRSLARLKALDANPMIALSRVPEDHVFLSYSREDRKWFEKVRRALQPLEDFNVHFWCDREIDAGQAWLAVILEKLSDANAALLLVSESFLKSVFIREHELPSILARAKDPAGEPFLVLWVPLASKEVIEADDLGGHLLDCHALLNPETPLNELRRKKLARKLTKLRDKAHRAIFRHHHKDA